MGEGCGVRWIASEEKVAQRQSFSTTLLRQWRVQYPSEDAFSVRLALPVSNDDQLTLCEGWRGCRVEAKSKKISYLRARTLSELLTRLSEGSIQRSRCSMNRDSEMRSVQAVTGERKKSERRVRELTRWQSSKHSQKSHTALIRYN